MNIAEVVEQLRMDDHIVTTYDNYVDSCLARGEHSYFSFQDFVVISTNRAIREFIYVLREREALHNLKMDFLLGPEGNVIHTALIAIGSNVLALLAIDAGFQEADNEMAEKIRRIGEGEQL